VVVPGSGERCPGEGKAAEPGEQHMAGVWREPPGQLDMVGTFGAQADVLPLCIREQAGVVQVPSAFVVDDGGLGVEVAGERGKRGAGVAPLRHGVQALQGDSDRPVGDHVSAGRRPYAGLRDLVQERKQYFDYWLQRRPSMPKVSAPCLSRSTTRS
jgi:hypothetical protein